MKRKLVVVLDSNAIFGVGADGILSSDLVETIHLYANHSEIALEWWLPEMVLMEREYQLVQDALECLPKIRKYEQLTNASLQPPEHETASRVKERLRERVAQLGVHVRQVEPDRIDVGKLALDAAYRKPPFQAGKAEKGFKDAIVAAAMVEVAKATEASNPGVRVVCITADIHLTSHLNDPGVRRENMQVLGTLEELKGLVEAILSEVGEELAARLSEKAAVAFFDSDASKATLYFTAGIRDEIRRSYGMELMAVPTGAEKRQNGKWFIGPPRFVRRTDGRFTWATRIRVEGRAFVTVQSMGWPGVLGSAPWASGMQASGIAGTGALGAAGGGSGVWGDLYAASAQQFKGSEVFWAPTDQLVAEGNTGFEVTWSMGVGEGESVIDARVEKIDLLGTEWESR